MKRSLIILFISLIVSGSSYGQSVTFPSSQLQMKARELSGSELNWPLILKLAEHDRSSNQFTLSAEKIQVLRNFSRTSLTVDKAKEKINDLIKGGASIFAQEELSEVNGLLSSYLEEVKNGNIDTAFEYGEGLKPAVMYLDSVLLERRLVDIQAQLSKKDGDVDKRIGILGSWDDAFEGDLFKESDGVKTYTDSYANMTFVDGSTVVVNPQTEAVIRKSRIDKLDESSDTEITLVEGGLLTKLSAAGKEKGKYILYAGTSETDLNTLNFLAEADSESKVKLTNYDGVANVRANDLTITIRKNEGTIVEEGQDPLPPIKLLPAPDLDEATRDTIIYESDYLYAFEEVDGAVQYHVQYSTSSNFDKEVIDVDTRNTSYLMQNLPLGTNYVQVQAIDNMGLKGPYSKAIRVIRNEDNQPPPLFVSSVSGDIIFTTTNKVTISGTTERDAVLSADDTQVEMSSNGSFSLEIETTPIDQFVNLTSTDDSGNKTSKEVRVVKLTGEVLFNLNFQGAQDTDIFKVTSNPVTISGIAYPNLNVVVETEGQTGIVKTDSKGRWGITMPISGDAMTISFKDLNTDFSYISKSYIVQTN